MGGMAATGAVANRLPGAALCRWMRFLAAVACLLRARGAHADDAARGAGGCGGLLFAAATKPPPCKRSLVRAPAMSMARGPEGGGQPRRCGPEYFILGASHCQACQGMIAPCLRAMHVPGTALHVFAHA